MMSGAPIPDGAAPLVPCPSLGDRRPSGPSLTIDYRHSTSGGSGSPTT